MREYLKVKLPKEMLENPEKYSAFWNRYHYLFVKEDNEARK